MTKQTEGQQHKPEQPYPSSLQQANQQKRAEEREVAGRHKNDGQKDHKGAR